MATATLTPIGTTADTVLTCVTAARRIQDRAAANLLSLAADWADLHPALDPDWAAGLEPGCTAEESPLAGDGTPAVDDRCLPELGAALGRSTESARMLVADALELRHRLPRLWQSTLDCRIPVYVAREVAQATRELTRDAVDFVDRQLANLPTVRSRRVARLVEATIAQFMPDLAEQQRSARAESRHVEIIATGRTDGLANIYGLLDVADAIDLDTALTDRATQLGQLGIDGSRNVRRSIALGDLARTGQDTLDLTAAAQSDPPQAPRQVPGRRVVLYVHLSDAALTGRNEVGWLDHATDANADLVDLPVLSGQVRDWLRQPGARVIVKPFIDLNEPMMVPGYQVPDRFEERLQLRDRHCIFPWCHNRRTDADHNQPMTRAARRAPTTSPRCVEDITGRRRSPPGDTACSDRASTCGPARTAVAIFATPSAPITSNSLPCRAARLVHDHGPARRHACMVGVNHPRPASKTRNHTYPFDKLRAQALFPEPVEGPTSRARHHKRGATPALRQAQGTKVALAPGDRAALIPELVEGAN